MEQEINRSLIQLMNGNLKKSDKVKITKYDNNISIKFNN